MLQPGFHFIILMLADHKVDAVRVELAQRFAKCINLIVFAAQADHQHRPRVRMAHHVLQHGTGVDVIVTEL